MSLNECLKSLLGFLDEQIKNYLNKEDESSKQYLLLLNNLKKYTLKETKEGKYEPENWESINKQKIKLFDLTTKELGTEDWKKYIIIFWSGKQREFTIMTTNYGRKIWRQKAGQVRNPEGEKASEYWHKIKVILGEYKKNNFAETFKNLINI